MNVDFFSCKNDDGGYVEQVVPEPQIAHSLISKPKCDGFLIYVAIVVWYYAIFVCLLNRSPKKNKCSVTKEMKKRKKKPLKNLTQKWQFHLAPSNFKFISIVPAAQYG